MNHDLMSEALRANACGLHASEAAVALVIDHGYWLTRADFLTGFADTFPSLTNGSPMAAICWLEAITALDRGQLPASGSETRILRLAASLAEGIPLDLQDAITGLDDSNLLHVITAIRHAAGRPPSGDTAVTFLTPQGLETRHRPSIPIANPPRRSACSNDDTNRSNTASVGRRHSAASRMARDSELSLTDVQWVMGHAHLTTTEIYLTPTQDEVIEGVLAHHARQSRVQKAPPPQPAPGYDPQSLSVLFGRPS